jgi:hypothetical protein
MDEIAACIRRIVGINDNVVPIRPPPSPSIAALAERRRALGARIADFERRREEQLRRRSPRLHMTIRQGRRGRPSFWGA